jgi:hypothetical protein
VVLKKLDLHREALDALLEAVHKEPLYWGAWLELALLITDKEMVGFDIPVTSVCPFVHLSTID